MHELSVTPELKGYLYLRDAIIMELKNNEKNKYKTGFIYEQIAKKYNTTPASAERLMRHAIEKAWLTVSIEKSKELFGDTISMEKGKPTNSQFIATIVESIRLNHLK